MSAIDTYLDYIASQKYARDVRQAIVDAISQCYVDTEGYAQTAEGVAETFRDFIVSSLYTIDGRFQIGGVNTSTGTTNSSTNRIRLGYTRIESDKLYSLQLCSNDYTVLNAWLYTSDAEAYAVRNLTGSIKNGRYLTFSAGQNESYLRVTFKSASDGETAMTDSDIAAVTAAVKLFELTDATLSRKGVPADSKAVGNVIDRIDTELDGISNAAFSEWSYDWIPTSGTINPTTGGVVNNVKRVRSAGAYVPMASAGDYITYTSDFKIRVFVYSANGVASGNLEAEITDGWTTGTRKIEIPSTYAGKLILWVIGYTDDRDIMDADVIASVTDYIKYNRERTRYTDKKARTGNNERFHVTINLNWPGQGSSSEEDYESGTEQDVRCILRLPLNYKPVGKPVPLIMFGHGASCHISESSWYNNSANFSNFINAFRDAGYAIFDVDNTRDDPDGYPDWGGLPLMTAYVKAWEYVKQNYNVESRLFLLSDSMGTTANLNMMKWYSGDIVASIMTAPRPLCSDRYLAQTNPTTKTKMATAFGLSGTEWEYDRLKAFDHYENIITINSTPYVFEKFPPCKVMVGEDDTDFLSKTREYYTALANGGTYVNYREIAGADHTDASFLTSESLREEAVAWFERFR